MKQEEFAKYSDMYVRIKHKMDNIQMSLRYGLTNNDKAFLEMVSNLLEERDKTLLRRVNDLSKEDWL